MRNQHSGLFTASVNGDTRITDWKDQIDFNCTIHTKRQSVNATVKFQMGFRPIQKRQRGRTV